MGPETPVRVRVQADTGAGREVTRSLKKIREEARGAKGDFKGASTAAGNLLGTLKRFSGLGGVIAGSVAVREISKATQTYVEFERGLVGVGKTSDITGGKLRSLGEDIAGLSVADDGLGTTTEELFSIAEAAGQVGVKGSAGILAFTDTLDKLQATTDIVGDEGARSLAQLLNITGQAPTQVGRLGSVLVELGNTYATTERQILGHAGEVARATAIYGVSSGEAAALGAVLAQFGVRAELAGSAVGRTIRTIAAGVAEGGAQLDALAATSGVSAEEFRAAWERGPIEALELFLEGLGRLSASDAVNALDRFGLKGEEILKVIPILAKENQVLTEALEKQAEQWDKNTALQKEAEQAAGTLHAQQKRTVAQLTAVRRELGEQLAPAYLASTKAVQGFLRTVADSGAISDVVKLLGFMASNAKLVAGAIVLIKMGPLIAGIEALTIAVLANPLLAAGAAVAAGLLAVNEAVKLLGRNAAAATAEAVAPTEELAEAFERVEAAIRSNDRAIIDSEVAQLTKDILEAQEAFNKAEVDVERYGFALANSAEESQSFKDALEAATRAEGEASAEVMVLNALLSRLIVAQDDAATFAAAHGDALDGLADDAAAAAAALDKLIASSAGLPFGGLSRGAALGAELQQEIAPMAVRTVLERLIPELEAAGKTMGTVVEDAAETAGEKWRRVFKEGAQEIGSMLIQAATEAAIRIAHAVGEQDRGPLGGRGEGNFAGEGSELGERIGSIWGPGWGLFGAVVGGIVGNFINKGADDAIAQITLAAEGLRARLVDAEGQLQETFLPLAQDLASGLNEAIARLGGTLESLPAIDLVIRSGEWIDIWGQRFDATVEGIEAAMSYTIVQVLQRGEISGLQPETIQAIHNFVGFQLDEFEEVLALSMRLAEGRIGPVATEVRRALEGIFADIEAGVAAGINVQGGIANLQRYRNQLLGLQEDIGAQKLAEIAAYNAAIDMAQINLEIMALELETRKAGIGGRASLLAVENTLVTQEGNIGATRHQIISDGIRVTASWIEAEAARVHTLAASTEATVTLATTTAEIAARIAGVIAELEGLRISGAEGAAAARRAADRARRAARGARGGISAPDNTEALRRMLEDFETVGDAAIRLLAHERQMATLRDQIADSTLSAKEAEELLLRARQDFLDREAELVNQARESILGPWRDAAADTGYAAQLREITDARDADLEALADHIHSLQDESVIREGAAARIRELNEQLEQSFRSGISGILGFVEQNLGSIQDRADRERVQEAIVAFRQQEFVWALESHRLALAQFELDLIASEQMTLAQQQWIAAAREALDVLETNLPEILEGIAGTITGAGESFASSVSSAASQFGSQILSLLHPDLLPVLSPAGMSLAEIEQLYGGQLGALMAQLLQLETQSLGQAADPLQELMDSFQELAPLLAAFGLDLDVIAARIEAIRQADLGRAIDDALEPLRQLRDDLDLGSFSPLSAGQQLSEAQQRVDALMARLAADPQDLEAIQALPNALQDLLGAASAFTGGAGPLYDRIFAQVQAILAGMLDEAGITVTPPGPGTLGDLLPFDPPSYPAGGLEAGRSPVMGALIDIRTELELTREEIAALRREREEAGEDAAEHHQAEKTRRVETRRHERTLEGAAEARQRTATIGGRKAS